MTPFFLLLVDFFACVRARSLLGKANWCCAFCLSGFGGCRMDGWSCKYIRNMLCEGVCGRMACFASLVASFALVELVG